MNKKKIFVFIIILLICPAILIIKDKLNSEDNIYVLTEENTMIDENENKKEKVENKDVNISNKEITVYISGEVNKSGVVTLKEGDRLAVAVEKLGGTTKNADLNNINLAVKVKDEEHYIIPKIGEVNKVNTKETKGDVENTEKSTSKEQSKININKATIEELDELPGVGEATANKIVNHREENGQFKDIEEIKNVNGIGDKKFEDMKDLICVN